MYYKNDDINNYIIIRKVGSGVYSSVYKCIKDNKIYAMKVYNKDEYYDLAGNMEIEILNHLIESKYFPNIYDNFVYDECVHIIEEFLNKNVEEQLNYNTYGLVAIKRYAVQLLNAIKDMDNTKRPLIHTDLKPDNIIIHDKSIKIIDFSNGLYKDDYYYRYNLTLYDKLIRLWDYYLNEPKIPYIQARIYRAPEVILRTGNIDKADLWSIGCILVQMFTGEKLFHSKNEHEQLEMIYNLLGEDYTILKDIPEDILYKYFTYYNGDYYFKKTYCVSPNRTLEHVIKEANTLREDTTDFIDFIKCLMTINPKNRKSVDELLVHRFLSM